MSNPLYTFSYDPRNYPPRYSSNGEVPKELLDKVPELSKTELENLDEYLRNWELVEFFATHKIEIKKRLSPYRYAVSVSKENVPTLLECIQDVTGFPLKRRG